jgi:hypothetical protein
MGVNVAVIIEVAVTLDTGVAALAQAESRRTQRTRNEKFFIYHLFIESDRNECKRKPVTTTNK